MNIDVGWRNDYVMAEIMLDPDWRSGRVRGWKRFFPNKVKRGSKGWRRHVRRDKAARRPHDRHGATIVTELLLATDA